MRDYVAELRWFWCGVFLLLAERAAPTSEGAGLAVRAKVREAMAAVPAD